MTQHTLQERLAIRFPLFNIPKSVRAVKEISPQTITDPPPNKVVFIILYCVYWSFDRRYTRARISQTKSGFICKVNAIPIRF